MQGGATTFEQLGVSVQPSQGSALVFFPAFKDGRPDPRYAVESSCAVLCHVFIAAWQTAGASSPAAEAGAIISSVPALPATLGRLHACASQLSQLRPPVVRPSWKGAG